MSWEDGDFELEMDVPSPQQSIVTNWSGLLLEGIRRLDEKAAGFEQAVEEIEAAGREGMKDEMIQELARALKGIESVTGVIITARDGVVLGHEVDGDPQKEGAVTVFVGNAASQIGEFLALGPFEWGTVGLGKDTMLVLEQPDYHVGLLLSDRASPAMVASNAQRILR